MEAGPSVQLGAWNRVSRFSCESLPQRWILTIEASCADTAFCCSFTFPLRGVDSLADLPGAGGQN